MTAGDPQMQQFVLTPYAFQCDHLVTQETPGEQVEEPSLAVVTPYRFHDARDKGCHVLWSCSLGKVCRSWLCRFSSHEGVLPKPS